MSTTTVTESGKVAPDTTRAALSSLIREALGLLKHGYSIIPVRGKNAAIEWKQFQERLMSEAELIASFRLGGITGMAVVLGEVSGDLYCRDFDSFALYQKWAENHPVLSRKLPTVRTQRGIHVYFRHRHRLNTQKVQAGELRGNGAYTVLPPSKHPEGPRYEWVHPLPPLAGVLEIDARLAGLLEQDFKDATEGTEAIEGTEETDGTEESHVVSESATAPKSILEAVACCVPQHVNQNHACLFKLARGLLTIQLDHNINDDLTIVSMRKDAFGLWWNESNAKGFVRAGVSRDSYWEEFLAACEDARFPLGGMTLKLALQRAKQAKPPRAAIENFTNPKLWLQASLCRELQKLNHPEPFFLDCRSAAKALELPNPTQASRYFKTLCGVRILKVHQKGSQGKPTRFYYLPPLDELSSIGHASSGDREVIEL